MRRFLPASFNQSSFLVSISIASLAVLVATTVLSINTIFSFGWSDWWPALAISLRDGKSLYRDELYFLGPLYPLLLYIGLKLFGEHASLAVKFAGFASLAIFAMALGDLFYVIIKYSRVSFVLDHYLKNRLPSLKLLATVFLGVWLGAGVLLLFSTFLRPDDYHTLKYASLAFTVAGFSRLAVGRNTQTICIGVLELILGFTVMIYARTHEGIIFAFLASFSNILAYGDSKKTKYVLSATAAASIVCALLYLLFYASGGVLTTDGMPFAFYDSAKAKLGSSLSLPRSFLKILAIGIDFLYINILPFLKASALTLLVYIFIRIARRNNWAHQLPQQMLSPSACECYTQSTQRFLSSTKMLKPFLKPLSIGLIFSVASLRAISRVEINYLDNFLILVYTFLFCCLLFKEVSSRIPRLHLFSRQSAQVAILSPHSESQAILLSVILTTQSCAIIQLLSSGGRIDIQYAQAFFLLYLLLILYPAYHLIYKTLSRRCLNGFVVATLTFSLPYIAQNLYTCLHQIHTRLTLNYSWWGASAEQSLHTLFSKLYQLSLNEKINTDNAYDLINTDFTGPLPMLPRHFLSEANQLCTVYRSVQEVTNRPVAVWSYPHPAPAYICKNTIRIPGARYTLWYDVSGPSSVKREMTYLTKSLPDIIVDYDIPGAKVAHLETYGDSAHSGDSPISTIDAFRNRLISRYYQLARVINGKNGKFLIYALHKDHSL